MSGHNNESAASSTGKKRLLVVGVNGSSKLPAQPPLRYPEDDARGISWHLRQEECGFESFRGGALCGRSASTQAVRQAVNELIMKSDAEDLLLFYFIGHSYATLTNAGARIYLVTGDFNPDDVVHQPDTHLSLDWIRNTFLDNENLSNVIVILDCCNAGKALAPTPSDPAMQSLRVFLQTLDRQQHTTGRSLDAHATRAWALIVSTEADTPAYEGHGHTRMTGLILDALRGKDLTALDRNGDLTLFGLFTYLKNRMPALGPQRQNPIMEGRFSADRSWTLAQDPVRTSPPPSQDNSPTTLFDGAICQEATIADLDMDQVELLQRSLIYRQDEYQAHYNERQQMEAFGLLLNEHPSYGALLCFGRRPSHYIAGANTHCISWQDHTRQRKLAEKDYRGSLLEQFAQARAFLIQHLGNQLSKGDEPEAGKLYVRVLEEALTNALIHREYVTEHGRPGVMVEIFPDRIEILSPGGPPLDIKALQRAAEHHPASHPRNPQIMRIFYLAGHVERAGTGITRMMMWMQEASLPRPEIGLDEPRQIFSIMLRRSVVTEAPPINPPIPTIIDQNGKTAPPKNKGKGQRPTRPTRPFDPVGPSQKRGPALTVLSVVLSVVLLFGVGVGAFTIFPQWYASAFVPPATTIEIASELPTSGVDKVIGLPVQNGVKMAIDDANHNHVLPGYTLKPTPYNDVGSGNRHDPLKGASNLKTAIADNLVAGVIGPYNSAVAVAELPIANQAAIALISPSNTYPCLTKDIHADPDCSGSSNIKTHMRPTGQLTYFRLSTTDDLEGKAAADFFIGKHYHTVLLLEDDSDVYSSGLAQAFQHEWQEMGGVTPLPLVLHEIKSSIQDYQNELQAVTSSQPDLIYFAGNDPNGTYALLALSSIPQLKSVAFAGASGIMDNSFLQKAAQLHRSAPIYISSPIMDPAHSKQSVGANFEQNYNARGYTDYRPYAASAYDCTMILIQAIKTALQQKGISTPHGSLDQAGAKQFRQAILQALVRLHYAGATGTQSFNANGDTTNHTISFYQLDLSQLHPDWQWLGQDSSK